MSREIWSAAVTAALVGALGTGCGGTEIRVANDSTYTMEGIVITTPSNSAEYGTLVPGQLSDYQDFDEAYDIAQVTFVASGYRFEIVPRDYVGHEELGAGSFTYHLAIEHFGQGLAYLFTTED